MLRVLLLLPLALVTCGPEEPAARRPIGTTLAPTPEAAEAALNEARQLLAVDAKADPPRAVTLLTATFGDAPAHDEAAFLLARAAFRADQPATCARALDGWFDGEPQDHPEWGAEARVLRGWLLEREGRFREALPHYEAALAVSPAYVFARFRMASALAEAGDGTTALQRVDEAIERRPGLLEAHFLRAQLLRRAGRAEEAERAAEIHRLLNQTSDNTATTRESVLEKLVAYEKLEKLLPSWVDGRVQMARMEATLGQAPRAIERLKRLVADHSDAGEGWKLLVELLRRTLGDEAARRELARIVPRAQGLPAELASQLEKIVASGFGS